MNRLRQTMSQGFTLVEMMVIAPIVILMIGAFIALLVNLTGEVMSSRGSNVLAYDLQSTLNQIEEDVKLSTTYLAQSNVTLTNTKQGVGGDTTNGSTVPFNNIETGGQPESLILNALVTNGNPISSTTGLVYLANKPNSCSSLAEYSKNTPMTMNIVYFIDSNDSLWRRTIMREDYANAAIRCGAAPWQLPSCINGYNASTLTHCKVNDTLMLTNVDPADFDIAYYTSADSTTASTTANNPSVSDYTVRNAALQTTPTIEVTITSKKTIAGRDLERSGTLRVTRLDSNASGIAIETPPTAVPNTPAISSTVSDGHNVNFTWPRVSGAESYDLEYRINGGAWQSTTESTNIDNNNRTYTVTDGWHEDTVEARVRATNSFGDSAFASNSLTIPLWAPLILKGGWTDYAAGYTTAAYTKTKTGMIMLKGLVRNSGAPASGDVIGTLPNDYVPSARLIFGTLTGNGGNDPGRVDVDSYGNVIFNTGGAAWISLEPVRYVPSGTSMTAPSLLNGWVNYGGDLANAGYTQLSNSRVVIQGLVKSGTIADNTAIFNLTAALTPNLYHHMASRSTSFAGIGVSASPAALVTKGNGTNGYLSLNTTYMPNTAPGTTWTNLTMVNSWVNYGGSFTTAQYSKSSADNVVQLRGLIRAGSTTYDSVIGTLPAGFRPKARVLTATSSNATHARIDILANGEIHFMGTSNAWYSLDAVSFVAEQ